jgi:hypothetical protein
VLINIHDSGMPPMPVISEETAEAHIAAVNKILKPAKVRLFVADVNSSQNGGDPPANAGNADGDAAMSSAEREKAREVGGDELDSEVSGLFKPPTKGKGIKIFFTLDPHQEGNNVWGVSVPGNRTVLISLGSPNIVRTIAHEVGHALGHKGHNDEDDVALPTSNLMHGNADVGGTELLPWQGRLINDGADDWGMPWDPSSVGAPMVPTPRSSGGKQDAREDAAAPDHQALSYCEGRLDEDTATMTFTAVMEGFVLETEPVAAAYAFQIDADNDPGTGAFVGGMPGVDREVQVTVNGDGIMPPLIEATLIDHAAGGAMIPLPGATWEVLEENADPEPPAPVAQLLQVDVDATLLGLAVDTLPAQVVSEDPMLGVLDALSLELVMDPQPIGMDLVPPLATLEDLVAFSTTGLTPGATAQLFVDDTEVLSGLIVEPDGSLGGSFTLDPPPSADDFYFISIVQDVPRQVVPTSLPVVPWYEDFDDYDLGSLHGTEGWKGWYDDPAFDAPVSGAESRSGDKAVEIGGDADLVREHASADNGAWSYSGWQYIPSEFESGGAGAFDGSFFLLFDVYNDGGPTHSAMTLLVNSADQKIKVFDGVGNALPGWEVPYDTDRWVKIQTIVDLDDDWTRVYYDGDLVAEYEWTGGVFGDAGGALDIAAVDLFAAGSTSIYYDDLILEPIIGCGLTLDSDADTDGLDKLAEFLGGSDSCDPAPPCTGDTDGNDEVDIDDIVNVVLDFGFSGPNPPNNGDVNGDLLVNIDDIVVVVLNFGPCL